jgi:hypothetical protein
MYFRLYFKPDRRPHPKRIFDIVDVNVDPLPAETSPVQYLIQRFRKSGSLTLEYIYSRPSIDGTYRVITHREPKEYLTSDLEAIQECYIKLVPVIQQKPTDFGRQL